MIYLLEDDDNIRKLVSYALIKEGYEVKEFSHPGEFKLAIKKELPSLILLDLMLPEEDGLSLLAKLQANPDFKGVPVIILTAKGSEFDKVTGLDAGADDYIAKPFGMIELISRVRAVLRRYEKTKNEAEYVIGGLYVNPQKHIIRICGKEIELSFKEYLLLLTLLEANGNVVTREELLNRVWGEFYEESRTLDVHIRKLRVKLGTAGSLIKTIKNIGYRIKDGDYEK